MKNATGIWKYISRPQQMLWENLTKLCTIIANRDLPYFHEPEQEEGIMANKPKHVAALRRSIIYIPFQIACAFWSPMGSVAITLGLIATMLGSQWVIITFEKMRDVHLKKGIGTYITEKMLGAFLVSFHAMMAAIAVSIVQGLFVGEAPAWLLPLKIVVGVVMLEMFFYITSSVDLSLIGYDDTDATNPSLTQKLADAADATKTHMPQMDVLVVLKRLAAIQIAICQHQGIPLPDELKEQ